MHAEERHQTILRRVREQRSARVTDLAAELGVSPVTVRKDIELLAERGLVARVHGGAMVPEDWAETAAVEQQAPTAAAPEMSARTLGLIVPSSSYYFPDVIRGAREAVAAAGARLVLRISDYDPQAEQAHARELIEDGVDGLLLAPSRESASPKTASGPGGRQWYEELDTPVVLVERRPGEEDPTVEHVISDHSLGARLAVRHLVQGGHRRIALLMRGSTPTSPWIEEGYRAALTAAGLDCPTGAGYAELGTGNSGTPAYDKAMREFVDAVAAGEVDAVLVHPEHDALTLLQHLRTRGVRVPGQLAVVSYDDEVAALADIPLSAVAPAKSEVGRCAAELLMLRLDDTERPRRRVFILPELRVRESSQADSSDPPLPPVS